MNIKNLLSLIGTAGFVATAYYAFSQAPDTPSPPSANQLLADPAASTHSDALKSHEQVFRTDTSPNPFGTYDLLARAEGRPANLSLLIPKDAPDPKALAETEEDLGIMAHILEK